MKTIWTILILLACLGAQAATRITAVVTITNTPLYVTNVLTWNSTSNRFWTNAVAVASGQFQTTNSIAASVTNLKTQLDTYRFRSAHVIQYGTNPETQVQIIAGTNEPISIVLGGFWGTVAYITNTVYISDFVLMPPNPSQSNTFLAWQMTALATNLQRSTNPVYNVHIANASASNFVVTNLSVPGTGANSLLVGANSTASGTSGTTFGNGATNSSTYGIAIGDAADNKASAWSVVIGKSASTSNSQHSVLMGSSSYVSNAPFSVAVGKSAEVQQGKGTAIGWTATVYHTNSTAIGAAAATTTTNQIRMGTATETVSVPGSEIIEGSLSVTGATTVRGITISNITVTSGGSMSNVALTNYTGRGANLFESNVVVHTLTATNFSAPGSGGTGSIRIGGSGISSTEASQQYAVALGEATKATNVASIAFGSSALSYGERAAALGNNAQAWQYGDVALGVDAFATGYVSVAIGVAANASHSNSVAIAAEAATTADMQITLGTSGHHVSIPGELRGVLITNAVFPGTNKFSGAVYYHVTNVTGVANGDVLLNLLPSRSFYELSGNTAAVNICGIQNGVDGRHITLLKTNVHNVLIRNLSGAAGTAASERIYTGTGADVTLTNTPCLIRFVYRSGMDAWILDNLK